MRSEIVEILWQAKQREISVNEATENLTDLFEKMCNECIPSEIYPNDASKLPIGKKVRVVDTMIDGEWTGEFARGYNAARDSAHKALKTKLGE